VEELYDDAMSSGEAAFHIISEQAVLKFIYIGPEKDRDLMMAHRSEETDGKL
jgi:hypothetical protein